MLKIAGVILCVAGSVGYGWIKISAMKKSLKEMKIWLFLFQKIKSCVIYQKETLEGSCIRIGEKEDSLQAKLLKDIGELARRERSTEFTSLWYSEVEEWCKEKPLSYKAKGLLLQFPDYIKEADEQLQLNMFALYMEEWRKEQEILEQQIKEQQKPVMAISLVVGMMLSILLV